MKLSHSQFFGIAPKKNPRYLPDGWAQVAFNTEVDGTSLRPLPALDMVAPNALVPGVQKIYRYGQSLELETPLREHQYWFSWSFDVDVCRSQLAKDEHEWTFFTGDGPPRATYRDLALGWGEFAPPEGVIVDYNNYYPKGSRLLGLPTPSTPATVTAGEFEPEQEGASITITSAMLAKLEVGQTLTVIIGEDDPIQVAVTNTSAEAIANLLNTVAGISAVVEDGSVIVTTDAEGPEVTLTITYGEGEPVILQGWGSATGCGGGPATIEFTTGHTITNKVGDSVFGALNEVTIRLCSSCSNKMVYAVGLLSNWVGTGGTLPESAWDAHTIVPLVNREIERHWPSNSPVYARAKDDATIELVAENLAADQVLHASIKWFWYEPTSMPDDPGDPGTLVTYTINKSAVPAATECPVEEAELTIPTMVLIEDTFYQAAITRLEITIGGDEELYPVYTMMYDLKDGDNVYDARLLATLINIEVNSWLVATFQEIPIRVEATPDNMNIKVFRTDGLAGGRLSAHVSWGSPAVPFLNGAYQKGTLIHVLKTDMLTAFNTEGAGEGANNPPSVLVGAEHLEVFSFDAGFGVSVDYVDVGIIWPTVRDPAEIATTFSTLTGITGTVEGDGVRVSAGSGETIIVSYIADISFQETKRTLTGTGSQEDPGLKETRVYTYTFVEKIHNFEFQSGPAEASNDIELYHKQPAIISGFASPDPEYPQPTHIRIYRSVAGTYLFVDEIEASAYSYTDTKNVDALAEEIPSLLWEPPPKTMIGLVNLPNGIMAGFTGRDIYFCDPYHPHAWPSAYSQSVDYPIVGLGAIDTTLVVLTEGFPYFIQGAHPDSMTVVKAQVPQACVSKKSIISTGAEVVYASPDGLFALAPSGSRNILERHMSRENWQDWHPKAMQGYLHDRKYYGFSDVAGYMYNFASEQLVNLYLSEFDGAVPPGGTLCSPPPPSMIYINPPTSCNEGWIHTGASVTIEGAEGFGFGADGLELWTVYGGSPGRIGFIGIYDLGIPYSIASIKLDSFRYHPHGQHVHPSFVGLLPQFFDVFPAGVGDSYVAAAHAGSGGGIGIGFVSNSTASGCGDGCFSVYCITCYSPFRPGITIDRKTGKDLVMSNWGFNGWRIGLSRPYWAERVSFSNNFNIINQDTQGADYSDFGNRMVLGAFQESAVWCAQLAEAYNPETVISRNKVYITGPTDVEKHVVKVRVSPSGTRMVVLFGYREYSNGRFMEYIRDV